MPQKEKAIEEKLLKAILEEADALEIKNSSSDARTVADLLGDRVPMVIQDNSIWNPHPKLMVDIIGGMVPDIVLGSHASGENRIYIEVKELEPLGHNRYGIEDSQIVRYFLHLIAMSRRFPKKGVADIRRAVLLCAPSAWFEQQRNARAWSHFLEHFSGLAKAFDITLGELHADLLTSDNRQSSKNGTGATRE